MTKRFAQTTSSHTGRRQTTRVALMDILNHPDVSYLENYKRTFDDIAMAGVDVDFLELADIAFDRIDQIYDGIIVSGSITPHCSRDTWIVSLTALIRRVYRERRIPLMGLCMAHELIATMFGGLVLPGATKELGTVTLTNIGQAESAGLTRGLPTQFQLLSAHSRDVVVPPPGSVALAKNDRNNCQVFRFANLFGVQSHPEIDAAAMRHWLTTREGTEGLIQERLIADESELDRFLADNVKECPARLTIFANFLALCAATKEVRASGQAVALMPKESGVA